MTTWHSVQGMLGLGVVCKACLESYWMTTWCSVQGMLGVLLDDYLV